MELTKGARIVRAQAAPDVRSGTISSILLWKNARLRSCERWELVNNAEKNRMSHSRSAPRLWAQENKKDGYPFVETAKKKTVRGICPESYRFGRYLYLEKVLLVKGQRVQQGVIYKLSIFVKHGHVQILRAGGNSPCFASWYVFDFAIL